MASHEVVLGLGNASGMFYHAPVGTALPAHPLATIPETWKEVGLVSDAGVTFKPYGNTTQLKDWSNSIRRTATTEKGSCKAVIISTKAETLKTVFGEGSVVVTPATADHGELVDVDTGKGLTDVHEAFMFIGKDGDNAFMFGCSDAVVQSVDDVTAAPGNAISWGATIQGDWHFVADDGKKTT